MVQAFINIFKIPDLKKKLLFTLALIAVYRIGAYIPTPGVDTLALGSFFDRMSQGTGGTLFGMMNMFSGGAMQRATIFALGIMPYISASIIIQLLTAVIPALERLAKEGEAGHRKINQYTRYGTIALSIIQAFITALWLENPSHFGGSVIVPNPGLAFRLVTIIQNRYRRCLCFNTCIYLIYQPPAVTSCINKTNYPHCKNILYYILQNFRLINSYVIYVATRTTIFS